MMEPYQAHAAGGTDPPGSARLVVLGGSGVIGKAVQALCAALDRTCLTISSGDIDLARPEAAEQLKGKLDSTDHVLLLAAMPPSRDRGAAAVLQNVQIARTAALACSSAGVRHVLYLGSDGVYVPTDAPIDEQSAVSAADCYRAAHLAREAIMRDMIDPDRLCIVRSTQIYSPDDTHIAYGPCRFARELIETGAISLFGEGEERRDHMAAEDLATVLVGLSDARQTGLLNAATGHSVSFAEIAARLYRLAGRAYTPRLTPRRVAVFHRSFDVSALRQALGSFATEPLDRGLARLLAGAIARRDAPRGRRAVFLDRDGVVNETQVEHGKPYAPRRFEDFRLYPGAPAAIGRLREAGFLVVVVTNQPDVGHGVTPSADLDAMHEKLIAETKVDDVLACTHRQEDGCGCRKPGAGMLVQAALRHDIDLRSSFMVGDRKSDIAAGRDAGCRTVFIDRGYKEGSPSPPADVTIGAETGLEGAVDAILGPHR